jgi:DinB superfamily
MALNPYAGFLADQDPRAVLAATPGLIHQAVCDLTPEQIAAPIAPGKWSPCEIVAHLADCELVFSFRLRQTLAEPNPTLQPFDQDTWATRYAAYDLPSALELFRATRTWNLKLIGNATDADFAREATHPERGTMTFQTIVETMAGHDLNHLAQLQNLSQPLS